jgi:hypothetical protein
VPNERPIPPRPADALAPKRSTWIRPGHIVIPMTKVLEKALEGARHLPATEQDEIARVIMQLSGGDLLAPIPLSQGERDAIARSKSAAARGEFATDEQVRAVWSKHGL